MAVRRPEQRPPTRRRHLSLGLGVFVALLGLFGSSTPTYAEPGLDDEGGTLTLREQLEVTATNYYNAKATLTQSQQRQAEITTKLRDAELSLARMETEVATIAAGRYKGAQLNVLSGLFTGQGNPQELLAGAALSDYLVWRDDENLRQYRTAKDESELQRTLLDAEVAIQAKALADLDQQKRDAEKALAAVGGMVSAGYNGPVPEAQPAPRNADGSWPRESCSIKDPTKTGGCITPRMFHASTRPAWPASPGSPSAGGPRAGVSTPRAAPVTSPSAQSTSAARPPGADKEYGDAPGQLVHGERRGARCDLRDLVPTDLDARDRLAHVLRLQATRPAPTRTTSIYRCCSPGVALHDSGPQDRAP